MPNNRPALHRFFKEWGPHLAIAVAGAVLGLVTIILIGPDQPAPPLQMPSAEDRFIRKPPVKEPRPRQETRYQRPERPTVLPPAAVKPSPPPRVRPQPQNLADNMPSRPVTGGPPRVPAAGTAPWEKFSVLPPPIENRPMIAVIIDDMGVDRKRTMRAIALPGPLTASFLAYGRDLPLQTRAARRAGHELLVHIPMEPENGEISPGPNAIGTNLAADEIMRRLDWALGRFSGYVGINNHMGSRFTADRAGMSLVLGEIAKRGLLFLDSRTTRHTVAAQMARDLGIPFAERHVFIDDDPDPAVIASQLRALERGALRDGYAVGIGHPRDHTLDALKQWLPALAARGFALVPISTVVRYRQKER